MGPRRPCRPSKKTAAKTAAAPSPIKTQPHHDTPLPESEAVVVLAGVTVTLALLLRVVLLTVLVVLLVVPGGADAVLVVVTVVVCGGSVVFVLSVVVVSAPVVFDEVVPLASSVPALLTLVAAWATALDACESVCEALEAQPPAMAATATPATSAVTAHTAEFPTAALTTRRRAA